MMKQPTRFQLNGLGKEILHLSGVLVILCAIVAGILGTSHHLTADRIALLAQERKAAAMEIILPGAEFVPITDYTTSDLHIRSVYGVYTNGAAAGLCIETTANGFGGEITLIVAIDLEGRIIGVDITQMSESAGGSKAADSDWLAQFTGKSGALQVVKNKASAENDIVALTSGTITSKAVTAGVQAAVSFANSYYEGGGLS